MRRRRKTKRLFVLKLSLLVSLFGDTSSLSGDERSLITNISVSISIINVLNIYIIDRSRRRIRTNRIIIRIRCWAEEEAHLVVYLIVWFVSPCSSFSVWREQDQQLQEWAIQ